MIASGRIVSKPRSQLCVVADLLRLQHLEACFERGLFHRRHRQRKATPAGTVRLAEDKLDAVTGRPQRLQRGHGKGRRAAEDQPHL